MDQEALTRLARAFNKFVGSSGRTMSGGVDIKAMEEPKRMFGAARCAGIRTRGLSARPSAMTGRSPLDRFQGRS